MVFPAEPMVWIIAGHYGTGKTEFSVNFARELIRAGRRVALADLDIVDPYFRSREQRAWLESIGVTVVASNLQNDIDLPALSPQIEGAMHDKGCDVILDVGGDDMGARVLGRFARVLRTRRVEMLFVLNINRPLTATAADAAAYLQEIAQEAGRPFTGIINNTHLYEMTTQADVAEGEAAAEELSALTGLPIVFHTVGPRADAEEDTAAGQAVRLERHLKKPWE